MKTGVAWAEIDGHFANATGSPPALDASDRVEMNGWERGFLGGGGVEFLVTPEWSMRLDYEYLDFGRAKLINRDGDRNSVDITTHALKLGISRNF